METFGDWLMEELRVRKMSQKELANLSKISAAQISRIISGTRGVGDESILAIAHALRIPPEIVYRAAGLLPPKPPGTEDLDEAMHVLSMLNRDDLREIVEIARLKLDRSKPDQPRIKQQHMSRKPRPARSALKHTRT